jgi:tRNA wybutosine-synthesizing protein 5
LLEHFNGLPREEILRVEGLEEFDEFEEWVIKCQHYFICAAVKDADPSKLLEKVKEVFPGESFLLRQDHGYSGGEAEDLALDPSSSWIVNIEPKVRSSLHKHSSMRQGHTSIFVQGVSVQGYSEVVVVFGGQCHNRLDDIKILGVGGEDLIWKNPTVSGATPAPRVFHAAVSFAPGKLLVVGGRGSPRKPVGDVCCLNLESMFWEKWELNWEGALQTLSRWRHSATLVQGGPQHGKVVIFGGRSVGQGRNEFRAHADVLLLDPKTRTIKELPTIGDQPPARYSHTLTGVGGGRMVLFGGMDESRVAYNDAYILDVDEGSWKLLETSGGVPYPVFSHSANSVTLPPEENSENSETPIPLDVYGDQRATHVVVIGGCSPLSRNYVHSLDLVSLQWKRLATGFSTFSGDALSPPQANPSVPLLFAKHTATLVSQNRLCIIGGGALCFSFGNYFNPVCVLRLRPDGKDIFPFLGVTARSIEEPAENSDFPFLGIGLPEGTKGEIKILESPSRGDFAELLLRREPVILRGLDFGPCKELWRDIGYLRKSEARAFSAREFTEENLDFLNKNYDFRTMPFGDIIDLIFGEEGACDPDQTPAKRYYFRSIGEDARKQPSDIRTAVPNLSKDFHVPEELSFASEREFSSILRVSSKHIRVWTHYDVMDNILCQVVGTKTVTLWHPNEVSNLYVDGSTSRVLDINNPDLKKFPRFACASSLVGTLQSGDILFLPSLWFHNTWTEDPSISINVFFKHLSDEMYEAKDLYGNKDLIIAEQAMAEVEKACERLGNLPAHYSQFYLRKLLSSVESHLVKK